MSSWCKPRGVCLRLWFPIGVDMAALAGMSMHPLVEDVVRSYLALVDAEADGLVEGLYLEGSVTLGRFSPSHQ